MFKTVINEYEQKSGYYFRMPSTKDEIKDQLKAMFPTPNGFQGKSKQVNNLLIEQSLRINPNILAGQKTSRQDISATKNYLIAKMDTFSFEKIMDALKIKGGKNPNATEWEEVIVKRGNYELAIGYNYKANYIGMKIAMALREMTDNYTDEFKLPGKVSLNANWSKLLFGLKKTDDTPKTDIILGSHKMSLKKKGDSQIFSGGKAESYAILTYALNRYIEGNEESIIKKIDEVTKRFESNESFNDNNNFSAYLLTTFKWSDNVKKFIKMNKEVFKQDIENKATVILKAMAVDYFKFLQKTELKSTPKEFSNNFKQSFINNIQNIWYKNLNDMKIIQDIASNTDSATDEEIFQVEEILAEIRSNYRGDSVKGKKNINKESLDLIKKKIQGSYNSKFSEYEKYINAKKQFQMSTKILNDIFTDNPEVKTYMIYEAITGDFKFDKNIGAANHLCVFDAEKGEVTYNHVDMTFVESIKNKFNIAYTFKSKQDDIEDDSKAALRAYYTSDPVPTSESHLLNFYSINENFVQYLKNKYKSFNRALVKILLSRIKKIFKKANNKIRMLTKLFRSEIKRDSIEIKEDLI